MNHQEPDRTQSLAKALTEEHRKAEARLWAEMEKRGLLKAAGWRIVEFTRESEGGTEIVLRPLHLYLPSPAGLECVVGIIDEAGAVRSRCEPGSKG